MNAGGTATVEQRVWIDAPPATVWNFFTDPDRLVQWWGAAELDARPGGALRVSMDAGPRPVMRGSFVELRPHERIAFTFGWEPGAGMPAVAPGSSLVEVSLTERDGGTALILRHSGLPAALGDETGEGWADHLGRLARTAAART